MKTGSGIRAFYRCVAGDQPQVGVLEGVRKRIEEKFLKASPAVNIAKSLGAPATVEPMTAYPAGHEKAIRYFQHLLAAVIKVAPDRLEADDPLEWYGIDSVMAMQLTNQLETTFGSLPKTLFFEYQTIKDLTRFFLESYRPQMEELLGLEESQASSVSSDAPKLSHETGTTVLRSRKPNSSIPMTTGLTSGKGSIREDIAIIGISGRYPEARNIRELWKNLRDGKDCIREIPAERWDYRDYFDANPGSPGKTYSKWGGFIEGVDRFEPLFFNISPREAELMDPQERLFLQCVYETLEDAGYARYGIEQSQLGDSGGNVGVFAGVMYQEYQLYGAEATVQGRPLALAGNSSVANRVSYYFNFHGPSMAVDTMCSSSLTAIHLACQSLRRKECRLAVAGGVNVSIHPHKYLLLGENKFVSSKGRCESFGAGGDGYVPGEGVGAVLLKPFSQASADHDHIYGVIKATAINHGGKTNGYTVPNPTAQTAVIQQALREAGIHPRTVSYLEAHGTGTALGDPIEIAGLNRAFQDGTADKQFCAIGSVKSNIGHCESAAGIAGLTKIILQMRHQQLVPSLHSRVLNPYIDFSNSPFTVQQNLAKWERTPVEIDGQIREYPRRAGLSSFGAGGSNAHLIIEEYLPEDPGKSRVNVIGVKPVIVVLSARNEERLKARAQQLLTFLREEPLSDETLADLAYTLQVGREPMEERLGIIVSSLKELEDKLEDFMSGREEIEALYRGGSKGNKSVLAVLAADEDLQSSIAVWIEKRKYAELLGLWVNGLTVDWHKLYNGSKPHRLSLPVYPFSGERYWISPEVSRAPVQGTNRLNAPFLHPLLHQNTSDFSGQRYSTELMSDAFYLKDHVIQGQRILPGVACLEMARAAVVQATRTNEIGFRLKNVLWIQPIGVGEEPVRIHIGLYLENNGNELNYEIYGESDTGIEPPVYGRGSAVLIAVEKPQPLTIAKLMERCNRRTLTSGQCYTLFQAMGYEYGPGHQGIEEVYAGDGQVLARLSLPSAVSGTIGQFVLHPALLDSALQASIALMTDGEAIPALKPYLPFALEELEIISRCTQSMWALIQYSKGGQPGDQVQKADITLTDGQGGVCARLKGLTFRFREGELPIKESAMVPAAAANEAPAGTILLTPVWESVTLIQEPTGFNLTGPALMIGGSANLQKVFRQFYPDIQEVKFHSNDTVDVIATKLQPHHRIEQIIWIAHHHTLKSLTDDIVIDHQELGVLQMFRMIKALLKMGYGAKKLSLTALTFQALSVGPNDAANPTHASLHGLIGSLAKEYPNWQIRLADLEDGNECPVADLLKLPVDPQGNAWVYRNREWYRAKLLPVKSSFGSESQNYRKGGIYVVIGGAGGIGEAWSRYLIQFYQAQMVWIGRRPIDAAIRAKIAELGNLGLQPEYIPADAGDYQALEGARREIKQRYGKIHGVIHSAMVLADQALVNMEEAGFRAALSAKVNVSVRIAQVFAKEPLDWVMFFSSLNAFLKAPGQSNYAAGCTFMDAFAKQLSREWSCAVKVMNWGYWGGPEMASTKGYRDQMAQMGVGSIEPGEAMAALEILMAGEIDQIALLKTITPKALKRLSLQTDTGEWIEAYPEELPSKISALKQRMDAAITHYNEAIQLLKTEGRA
jgi:acyl transferase domain-containing protein/acyl carrier protein